MNPFQRMELVIKCLLGFIDDTSQHMWVHKIRHQVVIYNKEALIDRDVFFIFEFEISIATRCSSSFSNKLLSHCKCMLLVFNKLVARFTIISQPSSSTTTT